MNRFIGFRRWAWSILVLSAMAFAMGGCSGDDGKDGQDGQDGQDGASAPVPDPIDVAVAMAEVESCGTCHGGVGDGHQSVYDEYKSNGTLTMTFDDLDVAAAAGGTFDLTLDFTLFWNGQPYTGPLSGAGSKFASPDGTASFYVVEYDSGTGEFYNSVGGFAFSLSASNAVSNGDGSYTLTENVAVNPTAFGGGAIVGRLATGRLDIEERQADKRVSLYEDYASASWEIGDFDGFVSAANVEACENCHGEPYRKHGTYPGMIVDGNTPEFAMCRGCHNNTANGGHKEWQHMVDDPLAWATGLAPTAEQDARYGYERTLQQDVHMSHALEFPYPQSMASCVTCHGQLYDDAGAAIPGTDKLAQVLDNSNFKWSTCQGCHVIEGIDASPAYGAQDEGKYYQSHRAPAFGYLWRRGSDLTFHESIDLNNSDCRSCHGPVGPGNSVGAPSFSDYHNGYDEHIYDDSGNRYAATYTASIDNIAYDDVADTVTVDYHASDVAVVPELLISFYGWDSKDFIVPSHWRDVSTNCDDRGCRFEFEPGDVSPLFTVDDTVVAPNYRTTANLSAFVAELTDDIPTMIDNMDVTKIEVTLTPYIEIDGDDVTLNAVSETVDLGTGALVANYFKGSGAIVDYKKCNACHDQLAVTFHSGSGRAGEIAVCRNCHAVTNAGSHLEMQSRSIDSYVHGIHSFQDFDLGPGRSSDGIFGGAFDPVFSKRYDMHIEHAFPYFTALACEGCHNPGTYNVPDQSKSMPGLLSDSWPLATWYEIVPGAAPGLTAAVEYPAGRNIGFVPEFVTGPASRACGACHRAELINENEAGDLASFNAHTDAFGTLVENDSDDEVLFGIINKIMTWFE